MTGEIDVSIGATLGLTAGMTGLIAQQGGSIPKMLLLCLVTARPSVWSTASAFRISACRR